VQRPEIALGRDVCFATRRVSVEAQQAVRPAQRRFRVQRWLDSALAKLP
jgi:hypothetical protein